MKKLFFIALISAMSGFAMRAEKIVLKGDTQSALGKYVIEKTDDLVEIEGKALPTYVIRFENSDQTVTVAVDKDEKRKIKNYIVLGDNLNIEYKCKEAYFGVSLLEEKYLKSGLKSETEKLNRGAYYHQKVLTRNNPSQRNCLGLIACYYPILVADYENEFACVR
jgi:hypothetical protein